MTHYQFPTAVKGSKVSGVQSVNVLWIFTPGTVKSQLSALAASWASADVMMQARYWYSKAAYLELLMMTVIFPSIFLLAVGAFF